MKVTQVVSTVSYVKYKKRLSYSQIGGYDGHAIFMYRENRAGFADCGCFLGRVSQGPEIFCASAYPAAQGSYRTCKYLLGNISQFRLGYFTKRYPVDNLYDLVAVRGYQGRRSFGLVQLTVRHLPQIQNDVSLQLPFAHLVYRTGGLGRAIRNLSFLQYILCKLVRFGHQSLFSFQISLIHRREF
jgi:hypothetical protein